MFLPIRDTGQSRDMLVQIIIELMEQKTAHFSVAKKDLQTLVEQAETRHFAEEIEFLQERGNDLSWLLQGLDTHEKRGVPKDQQSLGKRAAQYGDNKKYDPPLSTFWELFLEALDDFILKILIAASLVSIVVEVATAESSKRKTAWIEGFVVLLAVAICSLVTAVNNYSKERQFRKLKGVADDRKRVSVTRGGQFLDLHQDDLLVGDLVNLSEGMEVPADSILVEANQVTADESAMTGQPDPISKNTYQHCRNKMREVEQAGVKNLSDKHEVPSPILFSGTKVLTGEGKMLIIAVGDASCIGKIRVLAGQEEGDVQTPLQAKLTVLAEDIGKFGLYSAIAILVVLLLRFGIEKIIYKDWDSSTDVTELLSYFILALTVIVVAIPEGLPLSVTLSLAVSVKKMLLDNNLVRRMDACQTMGGANNICSDKTGTLTMNKMTLTQLWSGSMISIDSYQERLSLQDLSRSKEWLDLFKINACVNSSAHLLPEEKGSSTEIAILKYIQKTGINYSEERERHSAIHKYPFSSTRKRMSVIIQRKPHQLQLFVKGASQIVLNCCNKWYDMQTDRVEAISGSVRTQIQQSIKQMAESSLRTLCLAYKDISKENNLQKKDQKGVFQVETSNLILICVLGVRDIPRKEVPGAIEKCHKAGIKVRMVTGDNVVTATAIAKDIGIIRPNDNSLIMEGTEFMELVGGVICKSCKTKECGCARDRKESEEKGIPLRVDTIQKGSEFDRIKDNLLVLARSRPEDKYALVTGLKERGEVVAATGDGTNDAPALKKADVGFAMGIAGTEVAREAAAIILLDDNFNSIVKAVMWGRNIYDSIRKFIQFQMTVNIVAVSITLVGAALIKQQILAPIQMLWINLIMDTLASLALATEPPTEQLLDRPPNSRHEHIMSRNMFKHVIGQAVFQTIIMLILVFYGEKFIPQYVCSLDAKEFLLNPEYKWHEGVIGGTVRSGRMITIGGDDDYQSIYDSTGIISRHFTVVFNAFVMMQIFNFLNCRKIQDEINIFSGITRNPLFIIIVICIFGLQILLISFTGSAFHVYPNGLSIEQWLICVAFGAGSLLVNLLLKIRYIPEPNLTELEKKSEKQTNEVVEPTKDDLQTDSHIIKIREIPHYSESKYSITPKNASRQRSQIMNIGFH